MNDLGAFVIEDTRHRLVHMFPEHVRVALGALSEAETWARANEQSNSVGNLVVHLCGSSNHFLGRFVGGSDYVRDRPAEFARRDPLPRTELLRLVEETAAEADRVLRALQPTHLMELREGGGKSFTVAELLLRTSHHWAMHVGQIVFQAKALHPEAFDEVWMKTMPKR
jgi:uncharacterized damage-inducible protein DinB